MYHISVAPRFRLQDNLSIQNNPFQLSLIAVKILYLFVKHTHMKQNIGTTDKIIRLVVAAGLIGLYFTNILPGVVALIGLIFGIILALTAFVGYCGLYTLLGISTCPVKKQK